MFILSVMDALVKWLTAYFPVVQILFVRSLVMMFPIFFILFRQRGWRGLYTQRPLGHILRMLLNLVSFVLFFQGLARLPLADAIALVMSAPVFMALLSGPLLGEYARGKVWIAIIIGFAGMLLMVSPHGSSTDLPAALTLIGASLLYTLWMIQTRNLASTETNETMVFYSAAGIALATAFAMPFYWVTPNILDMVLLMLVGLISALGHTLLVNAYRYAPVYILGPFDYTALIWAVIFGFVIWGDIPGVMTLAGAALVIACGLYFYLREKREIRNVS
jgi:drug/metabolite transporter (DMT)-like permease